RRNTEGRSNRSGGSVTDEKDAPHANPFPSGPGVCGLLPCRGGCGRERSSGVRPRGRARTNRSRTARTAGPAGGTAGPARVAAPGATGAGRGRRRWGRRGGGRRGRGPGGTGAARRRRTGPERAGKGPDRERKVGVFRPVAGRRSLEADEPKLGVPQRR